MVELSEPSQRQRFLEGRQMRRNRSTAHPGHNNRCAETSHSQPLVDTHHPCCVPPQCACGLTLLTVVTLATSTSFLNGRNTRAR